MVASINVEHRSCMKKNRKLLCANAMLCIALKCVSQIRLHIGLTNAGFFYKATYRALMLLHVEGSNFHKKLNFNRARFYFHKKYFISNHWHFEGKFQSPLGTPTFWMKATTCSCFIDQHIISKNKIQKLTWFQVKDFI